MGGSEEIVKRTLGGLGNVGPVYSGRVGAAGVAVVKGGRVVLDCL